MNLPYAIEAQNLTKRVGANHTPLVILEDLNLTILAREQLAIVGRSGSGKSTLLGLLAGLDTPSSGRVLIHGESISDLDEDGRAAMRARWMGFVFQSFQLLPSLSALENVMLPLQLMGNPKAKEQAIEALSQVGLTHRLHHAPKQLSGGEQQRVAIARAFAPQPKLLFADEPTGNLDSHTGAQIVDLLFSLNQKAGTTLVLVTHDKSLAALCNRQIRLTDGRVVDEA